MDKYQLIEQIKNNQIEIANFTNLNLLDNDIDLLIDALINNYSLLELIITNNDSYYKIYNKYKILEEHLERSFIEKYIYNKISIEKLNKLYNIISLKNNLIKFTISRSICFDTTPFNKQFFEMYECNKNIKNIKIISNYEKYIEILKNKNNLSEIILNNSNKFNEVISTLLLNNYYLEKIKLLYINIFELDGFMNNLIKLIKQNKYLNYINIMILKIYIDLKIFFNLFFNSLKNKKYLKYLSISYCDTIFYITDFLQLNKNIKYLKLSHIEIDDIDNFINILNDYKLSKLTLTKVSNLKIDHLLQIINNNETLYELDISNNNQLKDEIYKLFDLLQYNSNLNKLNISNINCYDLNSFTSFSKMISCNNTLIDLNINYCLSVNNILILLDLLIYNKSLCSIQSSFDITVVNNYCPYNYKDIFIQKLCKLIKKNNILNSIYIEYDIFLNNRHYTEILNALQYNNTLTDLYLPALYINKNTLQKK